MRKRGRPNEYNESVYNEDIKYKFLYDNYNNDESIFSIAKIFKRTYYMENTLNKDIATFNRQDYINLSEVLAATLGESTLISMKSVLNVYRKWYVKNRYPGSDNKFLEEIPLYPRRSLEKIRRKYLKSINDLHIIVNDCVNAQDAACYIFSYYGFGASNMLKITSSDIHGDSIIIKNRVIKIEKEFVSVLEDASNQEIYYKNNGIESDNLKSKTIPLDKDKNTIIKGVINKGRVSNTLSENSINQRIKKTLAIICKKHPELNLDVINLSEIQKSGMLHKLYYAEMVRPLEASDYKKIRKIYGLDDKNYDKTRELYNMWKMANNINIVDFHSEYDKLKSHINRNVDYIELHKFQEFIGKLGEKFVLDIERKRLLGTPYAKKVTDKPANDSKLGYDILSYNEDGTEVFIEVKTEAGDNDNDFYITSNEKLKGEEFAQQGKVYVIYRVHNILASNKSDVRYEIIKDIFSSTMYKIEPASWRISKIKI